MSIKETIKKHKKKIIVSVLFAILITIGIKFFFIKEGAPNYITTTLRNSDFSRNIVATGTISPINQVMIGTQVSGTIEKIYVDYNSQVKKDTLLAELDHASLEIIKNSAEANLERAQANFEQKSIEFNRALKLFEKKVSAQNSLENADLALKLAAADLKQAKANFDKAIIDLSNTKIYSPINGIIIDKKVEEGQTVASSLQAPELFIIAEDLSKMKIDASISEADIGKIKKGQNVTFSVDAYIDRTFEGTIDSIRLNPSQSQNVVVYTVVVNFDNKDKSLLPGMTALLNVETENVDNAIIVPRSVFSFRPNSSKPVTNLKNRKFRTIWLLENNVPSPLEIEVLVEGNVEAAIKSLGKPIDSNTQIIESYNVKSKASGSLFGGKSK